MARNRIDDLRNHLFETLEALKDKDEPMDLDRARAIADVSKQIIETAKVEITFAKVVHEATGDFPKSGFLPEPEGADRDAPRKQLAAVGSAGRAAR